MKSAVLLFLDQPLTVTPADANAEPDALGLALVRDSLRNLADVDADVFVFVSPGQDPARDKERARGWLGAGAFKLASALGRNPAVQQRNAFRLVFSRGYERALLLANATPDLPAHAVTSALDSLAWKWACLGPVPGPEGKPDRTYALGFDAEGYMTEAFDQVNQDRPGYFTRLETLVLFYERKVMVLPEYSPVASLDDAAALAERCRDTRFALLPSVRLAAQHSAR